MRTPAARSPRAGAFQQLIPAIGARRKSGAGGRRVRTRRPRTARRAGPRYGSQDLSAGRTTSSRTALGAVSWSSLL
ncbi:hypothetical protein J2S55_001294 [Streptosporangium brasiliense]|uniref:Uncharacterized protein n=1 Tax=Streptosporangium brasiliense TaxID=47480 RepID=A0ABT9QYI5_9ACTN|nr:hypothetical protein [Streptosporangium brasiliense]